jgi:hypothetical protein
VSPIPVIAQFRKNIQPTAYAAFSPKNSREYDTNEPDEGRCSTSSPKARRMKKRKTPHRAYARNRPGPRSCRRSPEPRKSPVPIAPPMAIIWICRLPRPFLYPSSSWAKKEFFDVS